MTRKLVQSATNALEQAPFDNETYRRHFGVAERVLLMR